MLDRTGRYLGRYAPWATGSHMIRAQHLIGASKWQEALAELRQSVANAPIDSKPLGKLGFTAAQTGNEALAEQVFTLTGQLGWRDTLTQLYYVKLGLNAGAWEVVGTRLDALLRVSPDLPLIAPLLQETLSTEEGIQALADKAKGNPPWIKSFATGISDLPVDVLNNRFEVIKRSGGVGLTCRDVTFFTNQLLAGGLVDQASSLWSIVCPPRTSLIYDGQLKRVMEPERQAEISRYQGFDWTVALRGDVEVAAVPDPDGPGALSLHNAASMRQAVLRQRIALPPGNYDLSWAMPGTPARSIKSVSITAGCQMDQSGAVPPKPIDGSNRLGVTFSVDPGCRLIMLTFWLAPQSEVTVADVKLTKN
ncbi:tetratricopeptide repeat protein [Novosphingobium sp.]|uniref:tetratricopeptide repeat protein n=1 Tax=Novosphingobium sp. TaxID=1874826 RepID=UPI0038BDC91F